MRLRPSLEIALGCLAVLLICHALRREVMYGDGGALMAHAAQGQRVYQGHLLYLPVVEALGRLLAPLAPRPFAVFAFASALGTALGIAGVHAAALELGLPRGRAALAAALAFATPAVVFFGCVVEIHGVFLAPAGWACFLAARLATRGSTLDAVALGVATGSAALVHLTGLVLPLALLPLVLAWRRERGTLAAGRCVRDAAVVLGVHVLVFKGVAWALDPGRSSSLGTTLGYLLSGLDRMSLRDLPRSLWNELLFAFLPVSAAWLLAFARPALRLEAALTAVVAAGYAAIPFVLLGASIDEHGAYLLPLAFPLALLVARSLPPRAGPVLVLAGALAALLQLRAHDADAARWPDAHAVAEFTAGGRRALICVTTNDLDPVFKHEPRTVSLALDLLALQALPEERVAQQFAETERSFRAAGLEAVLMDRARSALSGDPQHRLDALWAEIERRYDLVRLQAGPLLGWRLVPR